MLASSAVYSCISLIANDISKLRIKLVELDPVAKIWQETSNPAYSPVLRKPNRYQTRIQFLSEWITMKLIYGNTYVLKERDGAGKVAALYVLNSRLVKPLVTEDGGVYYDIGQDRLSGVVTPRIVPASEIMHDRCICLFHPLIGVPPLFACAMSSTQGNRIQANSAKFFENMSRPSGHLTAPGTIDDVTAERLKHDFETRFGGGNIGKVLVTGDDLKYESLGTIPAQQSQLIEQMRWTAEDVAGAFLVPLYKISKGSDTKLKNAAQQDEDYYKQTLQHLIEAIELLMDEGLGLTGGTQLLGVELDLDGLLRMDPVQRAERCAVLVKAGVMAPNEARANESLPPVTGGEEPFLQQQNFPLSVLVEQSPPGENGASEKVLSPEDQQALERLIEMARNSVADDDVTRAYRTRNLATGR
jgi:HK97 family phage portal protein